MVITITLNTEDVLNIQQYIYRVIFRGDSIHALQPFINILTNDMRTLFEKENITEYIKRGTTYYEQYVNDERLLVEYVEPEIEDAHCFLRGAHTCNTELSELAIRIVQRAFNYNEDFITSQYNTHTLKLNTKYVCDVLQTMEQCTTHETFSYIKTVDTMNEHTKSLLFLYALGIQQRT